MGSARILVTGGSGFIGSGLVKALARAGHRVRVFDNNSRGNSRRLAEFAKDIEIVEGDIRDLDALMRAADGIDEMHHLAFVNGTTYFYEVPELVLDVGVRGMTNVIEACRRRNISTLIVASSSEVYQSAAKIPTDETAPLVIPDPLNPRYSYAAGKLISEIMAINFGRKFFNRVLIFRPHNVYGPDMGFEHVIPEFAVRLQSLAKTNREDPLSFQTVAGISTRWPRPICDARPAPYASSPQPSHKIKYPSWSPIGRKSDRGEQPKYLRGCPSLSARSSLRLKLRLKFTMQSDSRIIWPSSRCYPTAAFPSCASTAPHSKASLGSFRRAWSIQMRIRPPAAVESFWKKPAMSPTPCTRGTYAPDTSRLSNRLHSFYVETGPAPERKNIEAGLELMLVQPPQLAKLIADGEFTLQLHIGTLLLAGMHGYIDLNRLMPASNAG